MPITDITLNKVVDTIKAAGECHLMLNDVFVGEESAQGFNDEEKREMVYPYLWIDFSPGSYEIGAARQIQSKTYNIVLFVADKQFDNIKNDVEILSDTEGILSDLIQYILTEPNLKEYMANVGALTPTPGRDGTKDGVFGWTVTFPVRVPYKHCYQTLPIPCGAPFVPSPECPPVGVTPSGNLYKRPNLTGQQTSFRTGDYGFHLAAGTYTPTRPANPLTVSELDESAIDTFRTLKELNAFGNLDRFTDENGLQVFGNGYLIDHLTGLGWKITLEPAFDWNGAIDNGNNKTFFGFSDWRLSSTNEELSILDRDNGTLFCLNYFPFNIATSTAYISSSTLFSGGGANCQNWASVHASIGFQLKTLVRQSILCRNHY